MALQIDDDTEMNYIVPLTPADGYIIGINPTAEMSNLIFYQIRKKTGEHLDKLDVTGAILMSVKDLEKYRDAIDENLQNIKNREK